MRSPPKLPGDIDRGACLSDLLGVRIPETGLLDLPPRPDLGNPQGVVHGGVRNAAGVLCAAATITARSATGPRAGAP